MYRCSIRPIVAKIEHTPRLPWLRIGDCVITRSYCRGRISSDFPSPGRSSLFGAPARNVSALPNG